MSDRLRKMTASGHGNCLEAIRLEENPHVRLELLRTYVITRTDAHPKQIRRAKRLMLELTSDKTFKEKN